MDGLHWGVQGGGSEWIWGVVVGEGGEAGGDVGEGEDKEQNEYSD